MKPSLAGPKRPQDRVLLEDVQKNYREALQHDQQPNAASAVKMLGPGSRVVTDYLEKAGVLKELEKIGYERLRLHLHRQLRPAADRGQRWHRRR